MQKRLFLLPLFYVGLLLVFSPLLAQKQFRFPQGFDEKTGCVPQTIYVKLHESVPILNAQPLDFLSPQTRQAAKVKQIKQAFHKQDFDKNGALHTHKNKAEAENNLKQLLQWYEVQLEQGISIEQALNLVLQDNNVLLAEPKYVHFPLFVPNDPLVNPVGSAAQYHHNRIKSYQAWNLEQGNPNLVVGITDNGMNLAHPDGGNFVQGTRDDVADGDNNVLGGAHGLQVTLLSNASGNNAIQGAGVAFNSKYLAVKVASNSNLNAYIAGYEGILYAAQFPNCKVINMSWGRKGSPSNLELDFLRSIVDIYDVVLIAAAGNDNDQGYFYPAAYADFVLAVAGTNSNDIKSSSSSFYDKVGICAPGEGINVESSGQNLLGTSFAAPLVSGAAALVRSRFPNLNYRQVIRRLQQTADASIYNLAGNAAFVGRLGRGRLDVDKALSEPIFVTDSIFFANSTREGYIFNNETRDMVLRFTNLGNIVPNLQITLATSSPFVNIIKNTSTLTNVSVGNIINNQTDAFRIQLKADAPVNLIVRFNFTFTAGSQTYTEGVDVLLNPAHVKVNKLNFVLGDNGVLALRNANFYPLTGLSTVNNVSGINVRTSMLQEVGFLVGRSATQVSDAVRNTLPSRDNDFTNSIAFRQIVSPTNDYSYSNTVFTDIPNNPNRLNVQITQRSYAWNTPARANFVIVEYRVKNIGTTSLSNIFAGLFADWNVISQTSNRARWLASQQLGYVHDANNLYFTGITLLTDNFQNYVAYNNNATPLSDGFTNAEKFLALSNTPAADTVAGMTLTGQDVAHLLSAKIPLLEVGQEQFVSFAFVVGETFAELYQATLAAKQAYGDVQRSPTPIINNASVCAGEAFIIKPQGGSRFTFYTQPPPAFAIFTGNSLLVNDIRSPRTYYVTCADSLYESTAAMITLTPIFHQTQFSISPRDSLDLRIAGVQPFIFSSQTANAVQWQWSFGNGQTANVANPPPVTYTQEGVYQVKLVTRNAQNCADSLQRQVVVWRSPITTLERLPTQYLRLYPNPIDDQLTIETTTEAPPTTIDVIDALGRTIQRLSIAPNTTLSLPAKILPKGIILLKIQQNQRTTWQKMLHLSK